MSGRITRQPHAPRGLYAITPRLRPYGAQREAAAKDGGRGASPQDTKRGIPEVWRRKITVTVPEELVESIKERVDARGVSSYIAAAAHQDAMDRLRELAERLEEEHGAVTDDEQQALHRPRQRVFVFDSGALSKAVHGDREMVACVPRGVLRPSGEGLTKRHPHHTPTTAGSPD